MIKRESPTAIDAVEGRNEHGLAGGDWAAETREWTQQVTEAGYTNGSSGGGYPGTPQAQVGEQLPKLFLDHFRQGIARTFTYELATLTTDPCCWTSETGLSCWPCTSKNPPGTDRRSKPWPLGR